MEIKLTAGGKSAVYFDYMPSNYEPVHTQRSFFVYVGDSAFPTYDKAISDAERVGLKKLADENGANLIILNPFSGAWETETEDNARAMFEKLFTVLKEKGEGYVWYWQRDLITLVGDRRGADYISEYCAAAYPASTIQEGFFLKLMAQSVTLIKPKKAPCSSDRYVPEAAGKLLSAFIVNGSTEAVEGYKAINGCKSAGSEKLGCKVFESAKEKAIVALTDNENGALDKAYELVMSTFRRRNLGDEPLASVPRPNLAQIGVTKVAHCEHLDPGNPGEEHLWYEYIPDNLPTGKNVPLVLVLHGGGENGQYIMEMSRWAFLAKREGLICAAMTNHSVEKDSVLLTHLLKTLPVDSERCYATGFSMGGMSSSGVGLVDPRFAGVAPQDGMTFGVFGYTQHTMPLFYISGINDSPFPTVVRPSPEGDMPATPRLGNHAASGENGPPPPSDAQEAAKAAPARPLRMFPLEIKSNAVAEVLNAYYDKNGISFRYWSPLQFDNANNKFAVTLRNIVRTNDVVGGHEFVIGDLQSDNGEILVRLATIDGLGHDVHPNTAEFVWDFLKHFKRSADGKTIRV